MSWILTFNDLESFWPSFTSRIEPFCERKGYDRCRGCKGSPRERVLELMQVMELTKSGYAPALQARDSEMIEVKKLLVDC